MINPNRKWYLIRDTDPLVENNGKGGGGEERVIHLQCEGVLAAVLDTPAPLEPNIQPAKPVHYDQSTRDDFSYKK